MISKYLYHYTTFEALKNILLTRKILFTQLSSKKINDPIEAQIKKRQRNIDIHKSLIYISSWTYDDVESLPMWKMYEKQEHTSVRIRLPCDMFATNRNDYSFKLEECDFGWRPYVKLSQDTNINKLIESSSHVPNDFDFKLDKVFGPIRIAYIDSLEDINASFIKELKNGLNNNKDFWSIILKNIGMHKTLYWSYEKEIRFIVYPPIESISASFETLVKFSKENAKLINEKNTNIFSMPEYIFLPLRDNIFSDIEVVFGPYHCKKQEQNKEELEKIFKEREINGQVKTSKIIL